MHTGTVVSLVLEKGYGFIHEQTGTPDIFFHMSDLGDGLEFTEQLKERRVTFDVVDAPKGPRAVRIEAAE